MAETVRVLWEAGDGTVNVQVKKPVASVVRQEDSVAARDPASWIVIVKEANPDSETRSSPGA